MYFFANEIILSRQTYRNKEIFAFDILVFLSAYCTGDVSKCYYTTDQEICFQTSTTRELMDWTNAGVRCRENSDSTLPTIKDQDVQSIFERFIEDADLGDDHIWLNSRSYNLGGWFWLDGTPLNSLLYFKAIFFQIPLLILYSSQSALGPSIKYVTLREGEGV